MKHSIVSRIPPGQGEIRESIGCWEGSPGRLDEGSKAREGRDNIIAIGDIREEGNSILRNQRRDNREHI